MSDPTVSVVITRIHSLLDEESEILNAIKDQVLDLISKIEHLGIYLRCANNDRLLMKIANEFENEFHNFIFKVTFESRSKCSLLRRLLVEIAYEAEDAVENIICKVGPGGRGSCDRLRRYVCKPCIQIDHQDIQKIQGIIRILDKAIESVKSLDVSGPVPTAGDPQILRSQRLAQLASCPHKLVGLKRDVNSLVEKLTRKDGHVSILYIVGPGGSGKTTLATELYRHPTIKHHFESAVWASVSQQRDAKGILLEILARTQGTEDIPNGGGSGSVSGSGSGSGTGTDQLVYKVRNILEQGSYLIVLDDVGDVDILATYMFPLIESSISRSKIVITTRASPTHPYKYEEYVVGADEGVDSLAEKLTTKRAHETSIFHISAKPVGALVFRSLYEDERLKQHFDNRKWIDIGNDWDTGSILFKILEEIMLDKEARTLGENLDYKTQEEKLELLLARKSYLIILNQVQEPESLVYCLYPILENTHRRNKVIFISNNPPIPRYNNEEKITSDELLNTAQMVKRLTGEGDQPTLFSITDFDGSGRKSSLAKQLYDHPIVDAHFDTKFWITISKDWDATASLRYIIREITGFFPSAEYCASLKLPDKRDNKILADMLLRTLQEKMYLLVLDDMGDAEELVFDLFAAQSSSRTHKKEVAHKSRIIITVDNPRYFRHSNLTCFLYTMQPLTEDESWDLFRDIVVTHAVDSCTMQKLIEEFDRNSNGDEKMLGKGEILKKCNGIPLAVVVLGGLLSTKGTVEEWEIIISTALRKKETPAHEVLDDIISLSYNDLPSDITPCFLYLGLFLKDSEIPTGMLIRMWISEGLVTPPLDLLIREHTLEDVAKQSVEELACRCLIHVVRRNHIGEVKTIRLHDQIHELSITKSAELGFLEKYRYKEIREMRLPRRALDSGDNFLQIREMLLRRATIHPGNFDKYPTKSKNLRSLILFGKHGVAVKSYYCQHDALALRLEPIPEYFRLLRVLILCGIRTSKTFPDEIGNLIFLTYLGLRATNIQALPETIRWLRRLVTLDYRGTLDLSSCKPLPNVVSHMTSLRHVYLPEAAMSSMKKLDVSTLHNLQTLWGVTGGDWIIRDLEKLRSSVVKLGIINISCKQELEVVSKWLSSNGSGQLRVLKLDWHRAEHGRLLFPNHLYNFHHLHKLALIGRLKEDYNFTLLPCLVKLDLFFSHFEEYDPTEKLGSLPRLKILRLWNSYKGIRWSCGPNMFPQLEELQISHLPNLKEWTIEEGAMPQLNKLSIFKCCKLRGLPKGLRYVNLQQLEILCMPRSFCSRLTKNKNENTGRGVEDLDVIVNIPFIKFEACLE